MVLAWDALFHHIHGNWTLKIRYKNWTGFCEYNLYFLLWECYVQEFEKESRIRNNLIILRPEYKPNLCFVDAILLFIILVAAICMYIYLFGGRTGYTVTLHSIIAVDFFNLGSFNVVSLLFKIILTYSLRAANLGILSQCVLHNSSLILRSYNTHKRHHKITFLRTRHGWGC